MKIKRRAPLFNSSFQVKNNSKNLKKYFINTFETHPRVEGGQSARYRAVGGGGGLRISDQTHSHHTQHHQESSTLHLYKKGNRAVGGGGLHISEQTRSHHTQHKQESSTLHLHKKGNRAVGGGGGLHISDQTRFHHTQHHQEASTLHL
jgi:hypothetical protein